MTREGTRTIFRNAGFLLAGHGVTIAVRIIYTLALAFILGPAAYGKFNYAIAWYMVFLPFAAMGLSLLLGKEMGRSPESAQWLLPQTFTVRATAAAILTLVAAVSALIIEPDPQLRILLLVGALTLMVRAIAMWATDVFVAVEQPHWFLRQESFFRTVEVVVGILVAYATRNIVYLATVHLVAWSVQAVRGFVIAHRRFGPILLRRLHASALWPLVRAGIPISLVGVLVGWVLQGPVVLARYWAPNAEGLGHFVLALQVLGYVTLVPQALAVVTVPFISRAVARQDGQDVVLLKHIVRAIFGIGALIALTGAIFGELAVAQLFGHRYAGAGVLITELIWAAIPLAIVTVGINALMTRGLVSSVLTSCGVFSATYTLFLVIAMRQTALVGVPWAMVAGLSLWALHVLWQLKKAAML